MNRPRGYIPVMIVGIVAAAFFSQSSSSGAAPVPTGASLPPALCNAPGSVSGNDYLSCTADSTSGAAVYWDGIYPAVSRGPGGARATDNSHTTLYLSTGGYGDFGASGNSSAVGVVTGDGKLTGQSSSSSVINAYAVDAAKVRADTTNNSSIDAYADGGSSLAIGSNNTSSVRAVVQDKSNADIFANFSDVDAYVSRDSTVNLVAINGRINAYVIDDSALSAQVQYGSGESSALVTGSSNALIYSDTSEAIVEARDHSNVSSGSYGNANTSVRGIDGSNVDSSAVNSVVRLNAEGKSELISVAQDAGSVIANSAGGSVVHIDARNSGTVEANAANGGRLGAYSDGGALESSVDGGYSTAKSDSGASVATAATGEGSQVTAWGTDGASLTATASGGDAAQPSVVSAQAHGTVVVEAGSIGAGSVATVNATGTQGGGTAGVLKVFAADGGDASVAANTVLGDAITAAASGQGSRAYVYLADGTRISGTVITVYAIDGGTAYVSDSGAVGCFGGRTSVASQYGSCSSEGRTTVITDVDGVSTSYQDLQAPEDLVAPASALDSPVINRDLDGWDGRLIRPTAARVGEGSDTLIVSPRSQSAKVANFVAPVASVDAAKVNDPALDPSPTTAPSTSTPSTSTSADQSTSAEAPVKTVAATPTEAQTTTATPTAAKATAVAQNSAVDTADIVAPENDVPAVTTSSKNNSTDGAEKPKTVTESSSAPTGSKS